MEIRGQGEKGKGCLASSIGINYAGCYRCQQPDYQTSIDPDRRSDSVGVSKASGEPIPFRLYVGLAEVRDFYRLPRVTHWKVY